MNYEPANFTDKVTDLVDEWGYREVIDMIIDHASADRSLPNSAAKSQFIFRLIEARMWLDRVPDHG